jgi:hypothetical protein
MPKNPSNPSIEQDFIDILPTEPTEKKTNVGESSSEEEVKQKRSTKVLTHKPQTLQSGKSWKRGKGEGKEENQDPWRK